MLKGVSLNGWAQIAQIVSGFATFLALLFAAYEYYLHKKNNQYEAYSKMNERYCNNSSIQKVLGTMVESTMMKNLALINSTKTVEIKM